mgnify:CR=1 FL=1
MMNGNPVQAVSSASFHDLCLQVPVGKFPWFEHVDPAKTGHLYQVLVPAYDRLAPCRQCAGEELISIRRVSPSKQSERACLEVELFPYALRNDHLSPGRHLCRCHFCHTVSSPRYLTGKIIPRKKRTGKRITDGESKGPSPRTQENRFPQYPTCHFT